MPAIPDSYTLPSRLDVLSVPVFPDSYLTVDSSGSGDYTTIQAALNASTPGDTIYVRAGTYNERVTISTSGTAGNYITLRNWPGEYPVLNGTGLGSGKMIFGEDVSYIKVIGLEIQGHTGAGIEFRGTGSHIEVRDNYVHDQSFQLGAGGDGHAILINGSGGSGNTFGTPEWYNDALLTDVIVDGNTIGPNVFTGVNTSYNEALTIAWRVQRWQVTNNTVDDTSHLGTSLIGKEQRVAGANPSFPQYGYMAGNTYSNIGAADDNYSTSDSAIHVDGAKDVVIEDNLLHDNAYHGIDLIAEPGSVVVERVIVRRNRVVRNALAGIYASGVDTPATDCRVAHNSIYADTTWIGVRNPWGIGLRNCDNVVLKNNAIQVPPYPANTAYMVYHNEGAASTPILDYNLHSQNGSIWYYKGNFAFSFALYQNLNSPNGPDPNGVLGDPLYNNTAANDLTPQTGSPAINAGTPLTTATNNGASSINLEVADALWFHDGMGITGLAGDTIRVGSSTAVISDVNYTTNVITLASPISWSNGDGVTYPFNNSAPDIGAIETS